MKRQKLIQYLQKNGCELLREGSRHSIWHNPKSGALTVIPRHSEIKELMARKICQDLDVEEV
jgi:mRNA interferase HicA